MKRRNLLKGAAHLMLGLSSSHHAEQSFSEPQRGAENALTLFLSGDVMTARGIDQILPHPGDPQLFEPYVKDARHYVQIAESRHGQIPQPADFSYIWGDGLEILQQASPQLRVINLETSIATSGRPSPTKGIHYRMHPRNVECLSVARVDCCLLANNHVLDWGRDGLLETLTVLRATGIQSTGAGRDIQEAWSPAIFELRNRPRVLVFALGSTTSGIPRTWAATTERPGVNLLEKLSRSRAHEIARQIKTAKHAGDIVVTSIHWGGNWGYEVPHAHREFAYTLIEEGGADAVHGHSSHHPMAIEVYRGKPIFYGCGDLINDYEGIGGYEAFRSELALMYFPTISPADGSLLELRMKPMAIRKFRLNRTTRKDTEWMAKRMDRECQKFGTRVTLEEGAWLRLVP